MPFSRRLYLLSVGLAAILAAAGCAQKESSNNGSPTGGGGAEPPAPTASLKIGLVTPSKITDQGWSQSAYEAVQKMKTDLGAEPSPPVESPGKADVEGAIRQLAQAGNQLIFLHASEYDDPAKNVASTFPQTTFVVVGGRSAAANLTPIQFSAGEGTYLAGMLAAGMSKTGKIGAVGGDEIPIIKAAFASFEKGAKAVNPKIDVKVVFTGDGNDIAKAKQQAQALLEAGADVLIHNANAGGQGVAQAVSEKEGALFLGANADQSNLATAKNLGSFIVDAGAAYAAVGQAVKDGKTEGKPFAMGLKEKAVYFKYNDKFAGKIPEDLKAKIAQAEQEIIAGKIKP